MLSRKKDRLTFLLIGMLLVVFLGLSYFNVTTYVNKHNEYQRIERNLKSDKKQVLTITDNDIVLMSYISSKIDVDNQSNKNNITLSLIKDKYLSAKNYDEKIELWKSANTNYDNIVENTKMTNPNLIIANDNLALMNRHFKNTTKIDKILKQISKLESTK